MRVRAGHWLRSGVGAVVVRGQRRQAASRVRVVAVRVSAVAVAGGVVEMVRWK